MRFLWRDKVTTQPKGQVGLRIFYEEDSYKWVLVVEAPGAAQRRFELARDLEEALDLFGKVTGYGILMDVRIVLGPGGRPSFQKNIRCRICPDHGLPVIVDPEGDRTHEHCFICPESSAAASG